MLCNVSGPSLANLLTTRWLSPELHAIALCVLLPHAASRCASACVAAGAQQSTRRRLQKPPTRSRTRSDASHNAASVGLVVWHEPTDADTGSSYKMEDAACRLFILTFESATRALIEHRASNLYSEYDCEQRIFVCISN